MATSSTTLPPGVPETARGARAAEGQSTAGEEALVPQPRLGPAEPGGIPPAVALLPVELEVSVPVRGFQVKDLLALEAGAVIETQWAGGDDMPLSAGDVQLAWSEFEVVDTQLAVRVTRLA
ncbi:MAG TPA: FliM/FliN family flagellar motor C-terminal domain-containing protein [Terracidiphilus sp.]|nr:FliM/FliN family flagellar motor C-terminal domain-containing protein [Terracidiphilus sp.]